MPNSTCKGAPGFYVLRAVGNVKWRGSEKPPLFPMEIHADGGIDRREEMSNGGLLLAYGLHSDCL